MKIDFKKTALIVCHPDDEIFFFGGVYDKVDHIYICYLNSPKYPDSNEGRGKIKQYFAKTNTKITFLGLPEPGLLGTGDFNLCDETDEILKPGPKVKTLNRHTSKLINKLIDLDIGKYSTIITHNPWGENGHEEHIFVHKQIMRIQQLYNFNVLVNGFCSGESEKLMKNHIDTMIMLKGSFIVNRSLCEMVKQSYMYFNCGIEEWDWLRYYKWDKEEYLFMMPNKFKKITKVY